MRCSRPFSFVFFGLLVALVSVLMLAQSNSSIAVRPGNRVAGSRAHKGIGGATRTPASKAAEPFASSPQGPGLNFAPAVVYAPGGSGPDSVAVADVNGDGKMDLIVANFCDEVSNCTCTDSGCDYGSVGVLLGNGDGTFQPAVTYLSGGYFTQSVAVADVNGDGKADILVVNQCTSAINCAYTVGDGSIAVLLGNGDGSFQPAVAYDTGGQFPNGVLITDLNKDGKVDLVVSNFSGGINGFGELGVLLGNGDGTFQPAVIYNSAYSYGLMSMAVADVDGDGNLDLLVANECADAACASGAVGVLLGNGDGTFQPGTPYPSGGYFTRSMAMTDLNGDGKLDLVVANMCIASSNCSSNGTISVIFGNGDGSFQAPITYPAGAYEPITLSLGDFDGDGKTDIALVSQSVSGSNTAGVVSVLLGNGNGTFQPAVNYNPGASGSIALAVADVTKDGKPDLMVVTGAGVGVLLNTSTKATTTKLVSSKDPVGFMQPVTFTATVTPQGKGTPTGTVSFFDGAANIGSSPLNGSGVAALTTSTLALGTHSITASYNGDANWALSTSAALNQSVQGAVIALSSTSLNFGNQTVGVTSVPQTVTVTNNGNIELTIKSVLITGTNKGDFAQSNTCASPVAPNGSCAITVTFTPSITGVRNAAISLTDNAANSTQPIALTGIGGHPVGMVSPSSLAFGNQAEGSTSSSQKISLYNTGDYQMTVTSVIASANFAVLTSLCTAPVAPGAHCDVYVVFSPGQLGALSGTLTFTDSAANSPQTAQLTGIGQSPTTTTLTATPNPSALGQAVTLTAIVIPAYSGTPTGTVTFFDGTANLGTVALDLGTAQLIVPTLTGGSNSLTASYSGDAVFLTSVSPAVVRVVKQAAPTVTLVSNLNPSTVNQAVTFTATVGGIKAIVPTGSVEFKQGATVLATVPLVNGQASFTNTFTKAGIAPILARYLGDQNYKILNSTVLKQIVQK